MQREGKMNCRLRKQSHCQQIRKLLLPLLFISILGKKKQQLCASLQNKVLVKNSVYSRDSALT